MATIVTLFCLVHGDPVERAFEIDISNDKSVSRLKKEIKKQKENDFRNIDADKLTLWKVDISHDDEDAVKQLALKETDVIKKMSPVSRIGKYYHEEPAEGLIHVVIERPPG